MNMPRDHREKGDQPFRGSIFSSAFAVGSGIVPAVAVAAIGIRSWQSPRSSERGCHRGHEN